MGYQCQNKRKKQCYRTTVCIPDDGENYKGVRQTLEQIKARLGKGGILAIRDWLDFGSSLNIR